MENEKMGGCSARKANIKSDLVSFIPANRKYEGFPPNLQRSSLMIPSKRVVSHQKNTINWYPV